MKLSAKIPLDDKKARAIAEVDETAVQKYAAHAIMREIYVAKASLAYEIMFGTNTTAPDWLTNEAESKGMTVRELCEQILEKASGGSNQLEFEALRQSIKAAIRNAKSEQEISQLAGGFKSFSLT